MARCPYLGWKDGGHFFVSDGDEYYCKLCGKCLSDEEVKYKCDDHSDDEYEKCPIYKDRP